MSDTFPNQHSGESERWSFQPIEQLEHEMAADGVPPRVLDVLFGKVALAEELGISWHPEDFDKIRRGVPAHLAHFMPEDWEDKLEQGLSPFDIAEPIWNPTTEEPNAPLSSRVSGPATDQDYEELSP